MDIRGRSNEYQGRILLISGLDLEDIHLSPGNGLKYIRDRVNVYPGIV